MIKFDLYELKVGDRLYSLEYGYGRVHELRKKDKDGQIISVKFESEESYHYYGLDGKKNDIEESNHGRTLFWDIPAMQIPSRPKQKVKKKIKRYLVIYEDGRLSSCAFEDNVGFEDSKGSHGVGFVELNGEYEVEE